MNSYENKSQVYVRWLITSEEIRCDSQVTQTENVRGLSESECKRV